MVDESKILTPQQESFLGLLKAKAKFDWHIDPIQLGSRLLQAREVKDFPRMIKEIDDNEWRNFFVNEAQKLRPDIIS